MTAQGMGGRWRPSPIHFNGVRFLGPYPPNGRRPDHDHNHHRDSKEVLRGYGRANEAALASLMDVQDWQRIARQELERRATSIVQALDDATLEAIAAGTLDMRAMCRQVADEIHQPPKPSPALPPNPAACGVFMTSNPQKVHLLKSSICYTALE
jgi:hypothetical protein